MASIDFAALTEPLADGGPCGPNLEDDDDYLNYAAYIEGVMPESFFVDGRPFAFDPETVKVEAEINKIVGFLEQSRHLQLFALLSRLLVLTRDLHSYARCVRAIARLLDENWDDVWPRKEGGGYAMRTAALGTLNDSTVVFSLQYTRLCEGRRSGPVTYRGWMYSQREAEPREGEDTPTESALLQTMREAEEQVSEARESLEILRDALARINALWIEKADMMTAPNLAPVSTIVGKMLALINLAFPRAGEAEATQGADAAPGKDGKDVGPARVGKVGSAADAVGALAGAAGYFLSNEPSSPVLPLVAQAQQLLGKSFIEVLQTLLPEHVGSASYQIGGRQFFPLPVERLSSLMPTIPAYGGAPQSEAPAAAADDGWGSWSTSSSEETESSGQETESSGDEAPAVEESPAAPAEPAPVAQVFEPKTRAEALALLDAVAAWLRAEEPSSPAPWLLERARALADRDFLTVLKSVLPQGALTNLDDND